MTAAIFDHWPREKYVYFSLMLEFVDLVANVNCYKHKLLHCWYKEMFDFQVLQEYLIFYNDSSDIEDKSTDTTDTTSHLVVEVVVVVRRSWQATNVLQPVGLLYRPLWTFQLFATRCPRAY
jgi:hypothetical protein